MAYHQPLETFKIEDFSAGMVHENALPSAGALSLWSRGVIVTPDGKLSTAVGYCCGINIAHEHDSSFFEHLNQIYFWERASGGGTFLAATSKGMGIGRIYRFSSAPPDHRAVRDDWYAENKIGKGYFYPIPLDTVYTDDRRMDVECRDDFAYIDFVPFGDYCFVFDGRNSPLLIHPNLSISHARFPDVGEGVLPEILDGGVSDSVKAGAYVYAFVPVVGKLGEGPVGDPRSGKPGFITVSITGSIKDEDGNLVIDNYATTEDEEHRYYGVSGIADQSWGGYVLFRGLSQSWRAFPGMYKIRVYRTLQNSAGEFFYVGSVPQGEDTFMDALPDTHVGKALDTGVGKVPVGRLAITHKNRLWVVGDLDSGFHNILRYSSYAQPLRFPEEYFLYEPQLFRDDQVVRVASVQGSLFLFLRKSIVMLTGETPADYALVPVHYGVGCIAPQSVAEWRNGIIFLSERGPYFFDGNDPQYLGGKMEDFFADSQRGHKGWETAAGAISGNTYYLCFHEDYYCESTPGPGTTNNKTLALSMETRAWTDATTMPFDMAVPGPHGDPFVVRSKSVANQGGVYRLMEGWPWTYRASRSDVDFDGVSYGDNPVNMKHQPQVKFEGLDFGKPQVRKQLRRIDISYTGYYDDLWKSSVSTDEITTAEGSPLYGSLDSDAYLVWGELNEARVTVSRMRRSQSMYYPADQGAARGSNIVGKSFDVTIDIGANLMPQWAIIHSITFYFEEEDDH